MAKKSAKAEVKSTATKNPSKSAKTAKVEKPTKVAKPAKKVVKPKVKVVSEAKSEVEEIQLDEAPLQEIAGATGDETQVVEVAATAKVKVAKTKKESAKSAAKTKKEKAEAVALSEANKKWSELKQKHSAEKVANYNMGSVFVVNIPLQHKSFGWGFITAIENDRLEVLFETGTKHLISNYKR